jgi:hypothetical protein
MARHPELPPAAATRKRARRRRHTEHHQIPAVDEQEAHILATAYAAHRNTADPDREE